MTDAPPPPSPDARTTVTLLRYGYATPKKGQPLLSAGTVPLQAIAHRIRCGPQTRRLTEAYRNAKDRKGGDHPSVKTMKSRLPAIIPALALPPSYPVRSLPDEIPHTGLYVYDIDQDVTPDMLPGLLAALAEYQHTVMAATSTSGDALYAILAGPIASNPLHHKLLYNAIHDALPDHLRRHAAPSQNNVNRTRIIVHDPACYLAARTEPIEIQPQDHPRLDNPRRHARTLADPAGRVIAVSRHNYVQSISQGHRHTELVRSALAALPAHHADNHSTWITTAFRLAGGQHMHGPAFKGRELFAEWSRTSARYSPGDEEAFDKAFLTWDGRATTSGIINDAKRAGWRPPSHLLG